MAGGTAIAGTSVAGVVGATGAGDSSVSRDSFAIRKGTAEETTVYVTSADADGPTVFVIGGMHGNETAGYTAARQIADWNIESGTLVAIPESNAVAIDRGTRNDQHGHNLNRQFPGGETPKTKLARAIWDVVTKYDPDVVVDLHESTGLYAGNASTGVGQAVFTGDATDEAAKAANYVSRHYVDDPDLSFQVGPFSSPSARPRGLLVHKASRDLGADAFLVETLSAENSLETRVQWHAAVVERLVREELFSDSGTAPQDAPEEPTVESSSTSSDSNGGSAESAGSKPTAKINTLPMWASRSVLEPGQTVTLDASRSSAEGGTIDCFEWKVGADDEFEQEGEQIDVTVDDSVDQTVVLRVVNENGLSDTDEITLSTGC